MKITKEFLKTEYWDKGKSTWQIARMCGFKNSKQIWWRMKKFNIPIRTRSKAFLLNHPRRKKFKPISNEFLAYVIGVILGDGNVSRYLIRLRTTTLTFNRSFAKALDKLGVKSKTIFASPREQWNTYVCSVEFATWLKKLTLKKIEKIVTTNKKNLVAFIRGFYESEGSSKKWYNVVYIIIANSNRKLINLLKKFITILGFKTSILKSFDKRYNSYMYHLCVLGGTQEKLRFLNLIKPCIKSKPKQYPLKSV
jgi:hypothetical protein